MWGWRLRTTFKLIIINTSYKKEVSRKYVGLQNRSSIGSWEWLGGEGVFAELEETIMTAAYYAIDKNRYDDGNFIWTGINRRNF